VFIPVIPSGSVEIVEKEVRRHKDLWGSVMISSLVEFFLRWVFIGLFVNACDVVGSSLNGELRARDEACEHI
jgi:hypothetical protein